MRLGGLLVVVAVAACADEEDIAAPDDCEKGQLHVIHGSVDVTAMFTSYVLTGPNKFGPGYLEVRDDGGQAVVHVLFGGEVSELPGAITSAFGSVTWREHGLEVVACEIEWTGQFHTSSDGTRWRWVLDKLCAPSYAGGAPIEGTLAGCYRRPY